MADEKEDPDGFLDDIEEGKEIPDGVVDGNHPPGDPFHSHGREKNYRETPSRHFGYGRSIEANKTGEGQEPTMWCIGATCRPISDLMMWIFVDDYYCRIRTVCQL